MRINTVRELFNDQGSEMLHKGRGTFRNILVSHPILFTTTVHRITQQYKTAVSQCNYTFVYTCSLQSFGVYLFDIIVGVFLPQYAHIFTQPLIYIYNDYDDDETE